MIKTATQLKAKVRNLSKGNSQKAQTYIRNFIMERFLERMAKSKYRNNFILKGGMLVAAVVGQDTRATMDIDASIRNISLTKDAAVRIVEEIIAVEIEDGVHFQITKTADIMEEHDYPGIRFMLEAALDHLRQTIKIDISTGDVITPSAIEYSYKLMLEERFISIWVYSIETLLAEKIETMMHRGTANTRLRDFYDVYMIGQQVQYDQALLKEAFLSTCRNRGTSYQIPELTIILEEIELSQTMRKDWENYKKDSFYVGDLTWDTVMKGVKETVAALH